MKNNIGRLLVVAALTLASTVATAGTSQARAESDAARVAAKLAANARPKRERPRFFSLAVRAPIEISNAESKADLRVEKIKLSRGPASE